MISKAFFALVGFILSALGFSYAFAAPLSRQSLQELKITASGGLRLFSAAGLWYWNLLEKKLPERQLAYWFHASFFFIGVSGFTLSVLIWFL
ncbi:hypothetical protein CEF21_11495 [Bacillus sp. FJAT-42376]|uniref:hypothetical protein n=1 Tax=Bacillus sp. FJAT-42376 TaxID=2014076 RepID=UPI000F4E1C85|nr:hypothetical protein [Bacillus sp. FJAT-42376]AZB42869.1 hypothetical protein CEF21_11495 [Bacillus sp. FJAT-42376]